MVALFCSDSSDSPGLSPTPDDGKSPEGTYPGSDAEGTVPWQQTPTTHKRKGQKNKKKKSEGVFGYESINPITDQEQSLLLII